MFWMSNIASTEGHLTLKENSVWHAEGGDKTLVFDDLGMSVAWLSTSHDD